MVLVDICDSKRSILGNAVDSWFSETKLGIWFYDKVADISGWAAKKLKLQTLSREEAWKKRYPNIAEKINNLEDKRQILKFNTHE